MLSPRLLGEDGATKDGVVGVRSSTASSPDSGGGKDPPSHK